MRPLHPASSRFCITGRDPLSGKSLARRFGTQEQQDVALLCLPMLSVVEPAYFIELKKHLTKISLGENYFMKFFSGH
jgi:hypothetical protein